MQLILIDRRREEGKPLVLGKTDLTTLEIVAELVHNDHDDGPDVVMAKLWVENWLRAVPSSFDSCCYSGCDYGLPAFTVVRFA